MGKCRRTMVIRDLLLGVLVVGWIATYLYLLGYPARVWPDEGIPREVLLSGFALCAVAGALARLAGGPGLAGPSRPPPGPPEEPLPGLGPDRECPHCGQRVASDRKHLCDNCGLRFA